MIGYIYSYGLSLVSPSIVTRVLRLHMHLSNELTAFQAAVPQAALPLLPTIVPKITPYKVAKATTEASGVIPGKRKASGTPTRAQQKAANPAAAIAATALATAGGTSTTQCIEMLDSDSDHTDNTIPPPAFPKKEHGLTLIHGIDIKNHLDLLKSDLSIIFVKPEPGTPNTNYLNRIHFPATVLTITEAPVSVMNLLSHIKNIGNRKDVSTDNIIGFLSTNGVKLAPLTDDYKTIMTTDHESPIIIE
jgi:hypothetical protein